MDLVVTAAPARADARPRLATLDPALLAPLSGTEWAPVDVEGIAPITDDRPDILRFLFLLGG